MNTRQNSGRFLGAGLLAALVCLVSGCATHTSFGGADSRARSARRIAWPDAYAPKSARFFVSNEIVIAAPPERVWAELVDAAGWPDWYAGASEVEVRGSSDGRLGPGAVLAWKTMGLRFESEVRAFEQPRFLAWESRKASIRGYHVWLIEPTGDGGSRVITDEAQHGFLATMQGIFIPQKLHRLHDEWLKGLKTRAEAAGGVAKKTAP